MPIAPPATFDPTPSRPTMVDPPVWPTTPSELPAFRRSRLRLGGMLVFMGSLHFLAPQPFMKIIPKVLGHERFWVYASGIAELTAGGLMLSSKPESRRLGGWFAAATLVAVYPANISMALSAGAPKSAASLAPWLRLPLQAPLVLWAVRVARR